MSEWTSRLRQASFRGLPFGVLSNERPVGRRLAVHEYPYRDDPYVEDMGRATRRMSFRGFLLEGSVAYQGGLLDVQSAAMTAAAETPGPGELVHPLLGRLSVSVERLTPSERWEAGRYIELAFELVVGGSSLFGLPGLSTVAGVLAAADSAVSLLSSLFGDEADSYIGQTGVTGSLSSVASSFSAQSLGLGGGVAGVFNLGGSGSAALTSAVGVFRSASAGLGLIKGGGGATASAVAGVMRAISSSSGASSAVQSLGDFADDIFG